MKTLPAAAIAGTLVVALGGCGSSPSSSPSSGSAPSSSGSFAHGPATAQGGFNRGPGFPGATGKIAAVAGHTAQVQSSSAQTAVTWNSATTFTQETTVAASTIKAGDCVMAMPQQPPPSAGSSTPRSGGSTTVAAATVRILSTSGDCTSAPGGPGGSHVPHRGRPPGAPSGASPTTPNGQRPGGPHGAFGGFGAIGKVTAVSRSGFTVKSAWSSALGTTRVTTSPATVYTETVKANASAVRVGRCMTAQGSTDSTGAVTAKRISVTKPTGGNCLGGFGHGVGGGPWGQRNGTNGNA